MARISSPIGLLNFGNRGGGTSSPQDNSVNQNQDAQIQQTQQSIFALSQSLETIRSQVLQLENTIKSLSGQLQQENAIEQKNFAEDQDFKRRSLERNIRAGSEATLEQKITNTLSAPIAAIQGKVTNVFGNIMNALTTLFFGWLTNQGIETLKALTSGNKKKLEEIKWTVIKNVGAAIGIFAAMNFGFGFIIRSIGSLTRSVVGLTAKILLSPFRALGSAITKIRGGGVPAAPAAGAAGAAANAGRGGLGTFMRGLGIPLLTGTALTGLDIASGENPGRAIAGATTGMLGSAAAFAAGSLIPIPGSGVVTSALAYGPSSGIGKDIYDKFFGKPEATPTPAARPSTSTAATPAPASRPTPPPVAPAATPTPAAQSQTSMFSSAFTAPELTREISVGNIESTSTPPDISPDKSQSSTFGTDYSSYFSTTISPQQIQAPPKTQQQIGSLPEQKPNVIIADGGNQTTQMSSPTRQPLTDVPFIPSSNPDNFYVLYSQLNYNVVM